MHRRAFVTQPEVLDTRRGVDDGSTVPDLVACHQQGHLPLVSGLCLIDDIMVIQASGPHIQAAGPAAAAVLLPCGGEWVEGPNGDLQVELEEAGGVAVVQDVDDGGLREADDAAEDGTADVGGEGGAGGGGVDVEEFLGGCGGLEFEVEAGVDDVRAKGGGLGGGRVEGNGERVGGGVRRGVVVAEVDVRVWSGGAGLGEGEVDGEGWENGEDYRDGDVVGARESVTVVGDGEGARGFGVVKVKVEGLGGGDGGVGGLGEGGLQVVG